MYLLTPDGFAMTADYKTYINKEEAFEDFNKWSSQYLSQGYYSSVKYGKIPLNELWGYMLLHSKPFLHPLL